MEKSAKYIQLALITSYVFIVVISYFFLPEQVVIHWGITGEPNGYASKLVSVLIMLALIALVYGVMEFVVFADPKHENIKQFRGIYEWFVVLMLVFFNALAVYTTLWNLGHHIAITFLIAPLVASVEIGIGLLLPQTKPNYSIGIRTPWTLANDIVWEKTHKLGGILFVIAGICSLIGLFLPLTTFYITLFPLIIATIIVVIYSYFEFTKL